MHTDDKDFLSSVFPHDQPRNGMANNQDYYNNQSGFSNPHNNQDIMENLLALSSQNLAPNLGIQQQQNTRQNLLESQLKIQQLQQLQQLQQQIFQQQVPRSSCSWSKRSTVFRWSCLVRQHLAQVINGSMGYQLPVRQPSSLDRWYQADRQLSVVYGDPSAAKYGVRLAHDAATLSRLLWRTTSQPPVRAAPVELGSCQYRVSYEPTSSRFRLWCFPSHKSLAWSLFATTDCFIVIEQEDGFSKWRWNKQ